MGAEGSDEVLLQDSGRVQQVLHLLRGALREGRDTVAAGVRHRGLHGRPGETGNERGRSHRHRHSGILRPGIRQRAHGASRSSWRPSTPLFASGSARSIPNISTKGSSKSSPHRARSPRASTYPFRAAQTPILEAMGRRYRRALVTEVVDRLLARVEGIGIGMDIMAGFPGEDGGRFEETFEFIEGLDIYYLHVFPFSEREGTRACAFPGKVADDSQAAASQKAKEFSTQGRGRLFRAAFIGRILRSSRKEGCTRTGS